MWWCLQGNYSSNQIIIKKMKRVKLLVGLLYSLLVFEVNAQQLPQTTMNSLFPSYLNPAVVGTESYHSIGIVHRNQWIGLPDNPTTTIVFGTYTYGLNSQVNVQAKPTESKTITNFKSERNRKYHLGFGVQLVQDRFGPLSQTTFQPMASLILHQKTSILAFGISPSISLMQFDNSKIVYQNMNEPTAPQSNDNQLKANTSLGVWYENSTWQAGISGNNLIRSPFNVGNAIPTYEGKFQAHYNLQLGYKYQFNPDWKIMTQIVGRATKQAPTDWDLSVRITYFNKVWLMPNFRFNENVGLAVGTILDRKWLLGYGYDLSNAKYQGIAKQAHEITVIYKIQPKRKIICPSDLW